MNIRIYLLLLFTLLCFPASGLEVTGLRIETAGGNDHVSLRLSGKAEYKVFSVVANPPRVAVDIPSARWRGKVALPAEYSGTLIRGVRFGVHDEKTSRIVFDLSAQSEPRHVQLMGSKETGAYWLDFDLASPQANKNEETGWFGLSHANHTAGEPVKHRVADKPVIVIDAGHGGQDPGTSGHAGTQEKRVTLMYAQALKTALLKTGRFRVFLTREDDRYLFLRDRVKLAREAKGDLFISLHADSAPTREARGLSVYTISETASDKEAAALAAKENKADVIGNMDLSDTSQDVADILIDLTQRETRAKSAKFADLAIKDLGSEVHLLSNTHRFAGFAVLKAPDIPSVLIEIGFLTTPREESLLKSSGYQARVVHALVKAIETYFGKKR